MHPVVVITGAASGIGKGIAKKMANGYSLVLVDVNSISLNVVADEIRKEQAEHVTSLQRDILKLNTMLKVEQDKTRNRFVEDAR